MSTYNDNEPHKLSIGTLSTFTCDDIPFLRGADDNLCGINFLFAELVVSSKLRHCNAITCQTLNQKNKNNSKH